MHVIEELHVRGLWGTREIVIHFSDDVNILIGRNGAGKTTIINILAATLGCDFHTLHGLPFDVVMIRLREREGGDEVTIRVERSRAMIGRLTLKFTIDASGYGSQSVYEVDPFTDSWFSDDLLRGIHGPGERPSDRLSKHVASLVDVRWLPLQRGIAQKHGEEKDAHTVDKKLSQFAASFTSYCSLLLAQSERETLNFQKRLFISLLGSPSIAEASEWISTMQLQTLASSATGVFATLGVSVTEFAPVLARHLSSLERLLQKVDTSTEATADELEALLSLTRLNSTIKDWQVMAEKQREIMKPLDSFLALVNSRFLGKKLDRTEKNELVVVPTSASEAFELNLLSSGEKQLLILVGESLLQQGGTCIYIADEPELSLHVGWQETLVSSLISTNPNAQLIFATHSPDIVSSYGQKVIQMETLLT